MAALGTHISHFDLLVDVQQSLLDLRPEAVGHVHPGAGRALLPAVLKRRADGARDHTLHFGRCVDKVEVLTSALYRGTRQRECRSGRSFR